MGDAVNNDLVNYHSEFSHGVDDKRRVQIPAKWRPSQPETELTLILWPNGNVSKACIMVLPPSEMNALAQKIRAMPASDPKAQALRRLIGVRSANVAVDKAGRMCLPDWMANAVGITDQALLIGLVDRFEIWNPENYEKVRSVDEALLSEAFKLI